MQRRGFTIIEILIVVSIIGLMTAGAVLGFARQQAKSRDARRTSDIATINTALQSYIAVKIEPPLVTSYTAYDPGGWDYSSQTGGVNVNNPEFMTFLKTEGYMGSVPIDPINNGTGDVNFPSLGGKGYAYSYHYYKYNRYGDGYTQYELNHVPETVPFERKQVKVIMFR